MLVVILLAAVLLAVAIGIAAWIRRARSCARVIDAPAGDLEAVFHGGILCKNLITSGHTVRLELYDWGLRIRGIAPARWLVPTWEARYEELAIAELVASEFSRIAVWCRLSGESGGMGFLSERSQDVLQALEKHEVPVNRALTHIRRVDDLYRV